MSPPSSSPLPAALLALVAGLNAAERGFVLGRLATLGLDPGAPEAPLAEPSGHRCAQALARIAALDRSDRLTLMQLLAREAVSATPAGTEYIHAEALARQLLAESTDTLRLLAGAPADDVPAVVRAAAAATLAERVAAGSDTEVDVSWELGDVPSEAIAETLRSVLVSIVPVAGVPAASVPLADPAAAETMETGAALSLADLAPAALLAELANAGADLLGISLQGADAATVRRAADEIGAPWADRMRRAMAGDGPSPRMLSRQRARLLVAATGRADAPAATLFRLGAAALGTLLRTEEPALVDSIAQRLPADLGRRLRAAAGA